MAKTKTTPKKSGGHCVKSGKCSSKIDSTQRTYSIPSSSKTPPPPKSKDNNNK